MASYKDTFESHTFRANTFACGTWRGTGVATVVDVFACGAVDVCRTYQAIATVAPTYDGECDVRKTYLGRTEHNPC